MAEHPQPSAVRGVPCLVELTPQDATAAAAHLWPIILAPGEVLFRQGDPGDSVYVVVSGGVEVRAVGRDGEHAVAALGAGTLIGEFALLLDEHRTRSVVASSDVELWELTRAAFEAGLAAGESWATRFLMAVARELAKQMMAVDRQLVELMEQGAHQTAPAAGVRELEKLRRQLSGEWTF